MFDDDIQKYVETNDTSCANIVNRTNLTGISEICQSTCDSIFTPLQFWGANIVIFANTIYIFPYLFVIILYFLVAELRKRIYDRAVMLFCCTQVGISCILCVMAYFVLCHKPLSPTAYALFGLSLMFLTVSAMLWQFIICFDMTVTITRFQWTPLTNTKSEKKDRKFFLYSACVWGGTILPTTLVGVIELSPFVPKNWIIRPHFDDFDRTNLAVIVYVTGIPIIVCLVNNILFFYTTYYIVSVKRGTTNAQTRTQNRNLMKKYLFFLRLYILMDAPWITGALGSIFPELWVLKFVRMFHPIALLIAMMPRKTFLYVSRWWKEVVRSDNRIRPNMNV